MKKRLLGFFAAMLCAVLLLSTVSVYAASSTISLSGPSTANPGDTITLTCYANGSGIFGVQGELSFDSNQVTLVDKPTSKVPADWDFYWNKSTLRFTASDTSDEQNKPINSKTAIFTVKFRLSSDLKPGDKVTITFNAEKTRWSEALGAKSHEFTLSAYTLTIPQPKSNNANLKELSASNATITPDFAPGTTSYKASVPYDVSSLKLTAIADDPDAKVKISGNSLKAGKTTDVKIVVTAPAGNTKTYTIKVSRASDPNYEPGHNADASYIKVDGYVLSPAFNANTTDYVVWVPTETESVKITAGAKDSKASVDIENPGALEIGDNTAKVIVTAEDGKTTKEYTVVVKRADTHEHDNDKPVEPAELSDDASLIAIEIAGADPNPVIDPNKTDYDVTIPNEIPGFFANYTVADGATAAFKENPGTLPVGETDVVLTVTAEDGVTTKDYTFHVTREEEKVPDRPDTPDNPDDGGKCRCWTCRNLWWLLLVAFAAGAGTGSAITSSADKKKAKKKEDQ